MSLTRFALKLAAPIPNPESFRRYLFIGPHPDDIEIGAGATVAALTAAGKHVSFLICTDGRFGLEPCMRLVTTVSTIKYYEPGTAVSYGRHFITERRTRMGVLAIGYADGLPRLLSGKCSFAARGGFAPQRGSICMDMCMVDLTELPAAGVGSEVEIFGPANDLCALAKAAQTIPYELLCAVSKRVPRVYSE